jgi:hypothetical protein
MVKKKTSLVIEEDLWQDVKIHCIKNKIDISEWITELIKKELHKKKD